LLLVLVNSLQFFVPFNDRWLVEFTAETQFLDELCLLEFALVALERLINRFTIFNINDQHVRKVKVKGRGMVVVFTPNALILRD